MLRSIIALIGGFALMTFAAIVLTICAALLMGVTVSSTTPMYFQALVACATLAAAFGGYATAALAPDRHVGHSTILAVMVFIAQASNAMNPPPNQPRWYLITVLVVAPLAVFAGGRIRDRQRLRRAGTPPPSPAEEQA